MFFEKLLLSLVVLLPLIWFSGDTENTEATRVTTSLDHYCATDQFWAQHLKEGPELLSKEKQLEAEAFRAFQNPSRNSNRVLADYTLPVVVHIIHQNGPENISDATVFQGIQDLNDAFANVGYYNPATGADTRISFCLAQRDPDGNATNGITRTVSPLTTYNRSVEDVSMKNLSRWDPTRYINIWLVKEICSNNGCAVAGYAVFPAGHGGNRDGIAQEARWFGSGQAESGVQIHEMGHYLGVYHTFQGGCVNNNCLSDGDRVCDTPPDQSTAAIPCSGSANSCATDVNPGDPNNPFSTDQNDMFWNYMDYGFFFCYSAFTPGQVDRMHFFLTGIRASLLDSEGCTPPCLTPVNALFTASTTTINAGGTINFTNTSTNGLAYVWDIDGTPFASTTDASYTFNTLGTFTITLTASNADPNCEDSYSIEVEVTCPVDASFSVDDLFPSPGQTINFTNTSLNATSYQWLVDGLPLASTTNFSYGFLATGFHQVCLQGGNGFCEDEFCENILVFNDTTGCESTFVKLIGEPNREERGYTIIPSPDGNFYIAASTGAQSLLMKMDVGGTMIWQKTFDFGNQEEQIAEIIVDSENTIVGCGYSGNSANNFSGFAFRYDPATDNLRWVKRLPSRHRTMSIIEPPGASTYLLVAHYILPSGRDDALLLSLDRNTGNYSGNPRYRYDLGSSDLINSALYHNGRIYGIGRYTNGAGFPNMRNSLSEFDLNGNEIASSISFVGANQTARLYGRDFIVDNDQLLTVISGDNNGTSATNVTCHLMKTDLNGTIDWVMEYNLIGLQSEWAEEIVRVNNGYVLYGYDRGGNQDLFLMEVDLNGEPIWAKSYGGAALETGAFTAQSQVFFNGTNLYLIGESSSLNGTDKDIFLVKTDEQGVVEEACDWVNPLTVNANRWTNPVSIPIDLIRTSTSSTLSTVNISPTDILMTIETECSTPCVEICDNDIDDDGDGLIDEYDEECECTVYDCNNGVFQDCPECQAIPPLSSSWEIETIWSYNFPDASSTTTPVAGDVDGDCVPELVALSRDINALVILDGQTGALKYQVPTYATGAGTNGQLAIGDVDRNGAVDIFIVTGDEFSNAPNKRHRLVRYEFDGTSFSERFVSTEAIGPYFNNYDPVSGPRYDILSIHLADINMDGRPEAIIGNQIFDAVNGNYLTSGGPDNSIGSQQVWIGNTNLGKTGSFGVVADVLPDAYCAYCSGLELIAGNMVYSIDLINGGGGPNSGRMRVEVDMSNEFYDGFTSVADLNLDGILDVVTTEGDPQIREQYYMTVWNPVSQTVYDRITFNGQLSYGPARVGIANLDDQANDLEIALHINPYLSTYKLNPISNQLSLHRRIIINDPSRTSVSIFDFNGDGQNEILYRDEDEMRILRGSDLADMVLPTYSCGSRTNSEYPLVVDINADGQAEIIIICDGKMEAIGNAENGKFWASARKVWNQYAYFNVNINDDLTIPIQQQRHDLAGDGIEYNTFLRQYSDPNFPVANAELTIDSFYCVSDDSVRIEFEVCNVGDNILSALTPIAIYDGDPTSIAAILLNVFPLNVNLAPGDCYWLNHTFEYVGSGELFILVNDNGSLSPPFDLPLDFPVTTIPECDYTNNIDTFIFNRSANPLDLGPDIAVCDNGIWFLDAGPGFKNYRWQDGSTEQTYTTWETGIFWVEVEDDCGSLQRDSIVISTLPNTVVQLPNDLLLCEGDSVLLSLNGWTTYQWWPKLNIDCDDCPSVTVKEVTDSLTVVVVVSTMDGCYSTDSLMIRVEPKVEVLEEAYLCDGDTVQLYGNSVWLPGTYSFTSTAATGCDSIHQTELLPATSYLELDSINICQGDTILVLGELVWEEKTVEQMLSTALGCDSLLRTHISLGQIFESEDSVQLCRGDTLPFLGTEITAAGIYEVTLPAPNNCDSLFRLFVEENLPVFISETRFLCAGDTVELYGNLVWSIGTYSFTSTSITGCDSTHQTELLPALSYLELDSLSICEGDTVLVLGEQVWEEKTVEQTLTATNGCDSVLRTRVSLQDRLEIMETAYLCSGDTVQLYGNPVWLPGMYSFTGTSVGGCDSIHQTELLPASSYLELDSISLCEGDTIIVLGEQVWEEKTVERILTTIKGCDSIQRTKITLLNTIEIVETAYLCGGDTLELYGNPIWLPGTYSFNGTSIAGCDSIHQTTLLPALSYLVLDSLSICEGDTAMVLGELVWEEKTVEQLLPTLLGCDSLLRTFVSMVEIFELEDSMELCQGDTLPFLGMTITTGGVYEVTRSTSNSCDTLYRLFVEENIPASISDTRFLCAGDTLNLYGNPVWQTGIYSFIGTTINGCDSVHQTEVLPAPIYLEQDSMSICEGDTITVFGELVWEERIVEQTLPTSLGCDSIFRTYVAVQATIETIDSTMICEGDTTILFGEKAWLEGFYSEIYSSVTNCDSTSFIYLFVEPVPLDENSVSLCEGDTLLFFGNPITTAGLYEEIRSIPNSCDSVYRLEVIEIEPVETEELLEFCPGDTLILFNEKVWEAGTYEATFPSVLTSCDSTHTIFLETADFVEEMDLIELCEGEQVVIFGDTVSQAGVYTGFKMNAGSGCDTLQTIVLEWWLPPTLDWETREVCAGETGGQIEVFPQGGQTPYSWHWEGEESDGPVLENIPAGFYALTLTDARACTVETIIELEEESSPVLVLIDSLEINLGENPQISLQVFPQDNLEYEWSPAEGLTCSDCAEPYIEATTSTTFSLTVTNATGCSATDQLVLRVRKDRAVYIPNAFSPNGDGFNDRFTIFSDESVAEIVYLRIFDRWGEEIFLLENFQPNDPTLGWDGTFKREPLNPAVFVYVVEVLFKDNRSEILAGDLVLTI